MKKLRNICSLFMVLIMLFSCIPMTAFAEETLPEPVETPEIPAVPEKTAVDFMQWLEDPMPVIFQSDADIDMQYYLRMAYGIPEEISFVCEPAVVSYSQYLDGDYFPLTVTATGDYEGSCTVTAEVYSTNVSVVARVFTVNVNAKQGDTLVSSESMGFSTDFNQTLDGGATANDTCRMTLKAGTEYTLEFNYGPPYPEGYVSPMAKINGFSVGSFTEMSAAGFYVNKNLNLSNQSIPSGYLSSGTASVKVKSDDYGVFSVTTALQTDGGRPRAIELIITFEGPGKEDSKSFNVGAGSNVGMSAETIFGSENYNFSWARNGQNIAGANGPSYTAPTAAEGEVYVCTISRKSGANGCVGGESWTCTYNITDRASFSRQPRALNPVYKGDTPFKLGELFDAGSSSQGTVKRYYPSFEIMGTFIPETYVEWTPDSDYYSENGLNAGDQVEIWVAIEGKNGYANSEPVRLVSVIGQASPKLNWAPTGKGGLIYSGAPQALVNPGFATNGKLQYSLDNVSWSDSVPTATNAGTYFVHYRVEGKDSNYTTLIPENNSISVSIAQKSGAPAVTAPVAARLSYNGKAQNLLESKGSSEGGSLVYAVTTADAAEAPDASQFKTTAQATDAGMYKIWYKAETDNYSSNPVYSITAEIGKLDISNGTAVLKASPVYTGKELTQEIESLTVGDVSVNLSELTVSGNTATNVGAQNYVLTVGTGSSTNMTGSLTAEWNIQPCPISLEPNSNSKVYGQAEPVFSEYTANGVPEMGAVITDISISRQAGENVGEYKLTATQPAGKNANYEITFKEGIFEITPKELTVNVTIADKNYDGKHHAVISSAELVGVLDKDRANIAIDNTAPAEAVFKTEQVGSGVEVELIKGFSLTGDEQTLKNYTLRQPENIKGNIVNNWTAAEYTVSPATSADSWTAGDVSIIPAEGYLIGSGNTAGDTFEDRLIYSGETPAEGAKAQFYLKNKANGEISLMAEETYFIDRSNPTGSIAFGELEGWSGLLNDISFGLIFKDRLSVSIKAEDSHSGIKSIEYLRSESALSDESIKTAQGWQKYDGTVSVEARDAERFVYYARLTDNVGNVSYLSTQGAVFDTLAPQTDFDATGVYYTTQVVEFEDVNLLKLNGQTVSTTAASVTLEGNVDKLYTVTAEDKAGNKTEISVTMKPVASLDTVEDTVTADTVTLEDAAEIRAVLQKAESLEEGATAAEKAELEKIKQRLEPVLDSIEAAEKLRAKIDTLPAKDKIEPDSKQQHELYLAVKAEYDSLSDNEKKMVGDEKKAVLSDTEAALTAFKIVSGNNGWYIKNSGKTLTFKANGPVELELDNGKSISFKAVLVGGKEISESYYEVVAGSTYVTLKTGYLASLANGRYSIQLVYDYMGTEKTTDVAYFTVSNTPKTGDSAELGLFAAVMSVSLAAAGGIYLFLRRKKNEE